MKTLQKVALGVALLCAAVGGVRRYEFRNVRPDLESSAYVPLVNDILYRGIDPFGYDKNAHFFRFFPNVLLGRQAKVPEREDAWRLYLGIPQENETFTASAYTPSEFAGTCYSIRDFFDSYLAFGDPADQIRFLHRRSQLGGKDLSGDFNVMGGYTLGISADDRGSYLYYYDVWDLDVPLERDGGFFGSPFVVYDRLYFDPHTYMPERQMKPVRKLDDLERM